MLRRRRQSQLQGLLAQSGYLMDSNIRGILVRERGFDGSSNGKPMADERVLKELEVGTRCKMNIEVRACCLQGLCLEVGIVRFFPDRLPSGS